MRTLSLLLAFSLAVPSAGEEPSPGGGSAPASARADPRAAPARERTELAGRLAGATGMGLLGYALIAEVSGPVGWAAALIFFGGLSAYLARRRAGGEEDFLPAPRQPLPAPPAAPPIHEPPPAPTPPQVQPGV